MAGGHRSFVLGPVTYEVSVATLGGQVMEVDPALNGKIRPAAVAASLKVVGVALADAQPAGTAPTGTPDASWRQPEVAVCFAPCDVDVTYTLAANFGDALVVGTVAGQVSPVAAVTTPAAATAGTASDISNSRAIIGFCSEPGGVLAGGVGRMRLTR